MLWEFYGAPKNHTPSSFVMDGNHEVRRRKESQMRWFIEDYGTEGKGQTNDKGQGQDERKIREREDLFNVQCMEGL